MIKDETVKTVQTMNKKEYSVQEMRSALEIMAGMYDLARVVDPIECRILELGDDGAIKMDKRCYGIWNSDRKCVNCSSAVACRTGCHQEKSEHFNDRVYHIQSNPVKLKMSDGGVFNAVMELVKVKDASEGGAGANDRNAENENDTALRYRAVHDDLTGTLKADVFHETARELLSDSEEAFWTMITGDIMEFRLFSDLFGAEKGNEALIETADRLEKIAFENGGICSRLYRDKFAVLIPSDNYSEDDFKDAASAVRNKLSNGIYTLCIHFGVYRIENSSIPVSVMLDRANMALRAIHKDVNRTIAYFDGDIMQKGLLEQKVISSFDEALKNGEFRMYLQPIAKEDGTPFGAEALVRWVRRDGTVVPPAVFIETLENAGLIHELDRNIWEQAVRQLALWKDTDMRDLTISVNMSAKDLYSMDIYSVLTELTGKYGVDNGKLRIEITESALIDEAVRSSSVISKLQTAGFLVEIDDFGKGQSSLSLLKDINADVLKIDMGFLRETENALRSQIILRSVISMARELGMQVITEGVETEKQLRSLTSMGCSRFQGYYFSRPVSVEEFESKYSFA
ncbi:MAG: EAL domain-containing protein [Clostridia bacterium]|nr:EAL domain-containing protein [Clostridia bacterium]